MVKKKKKSAESFARFGPYLQREMSKRDKGTGTAAGSHRAGRIPLLVMARQSTFILIIPLIFTAWQRTTDHFFEDLKFASDASLIAVIYNLYKDASQDS